MNHILLKDVSHEGKEYGTLRSFEAAIVKETGASVVDIPVHLIPQSLKKYFGHGMNKAVYRKYFPRQKFMVEADIIWYVLMGPENYQLDLLKGWDNHCRTKILYLFDTLPSQYPLIKQLFSNNNWDILITSFNDAVDDLEKLTGRKWYALEQATDTSFFKSVPLSQRLIQFSAYGRREPVFHEAVKDFCAANDFYYDYTMGVSWDKNLLGLDLYRQYTWHLNHSVFTFSWSLEHTNLRRAGHLSPITCRWFEAAAAGTVMIGKQPRNLFFNDFLFKDAVKNLNTPEKKVAIYKQLEEVWNKREQYFQYAAQMQEKNIYKWSWNERVQRVLSWLE